MSWSDTCLANAEAWRRRGSPNGEAETYERLAREHDEWLVSDLRNDGYARANARERLAANLYRDGARAE